MIYTLAHKGEMPKIFTKIMRNGVPLYTVVAVSLGILIGAFIKRNFTFIYRWSEEYFRIRL